MDAQRELLDQLMGTARDGDRDERKFNDKNICKHFLCGLSPYDLFRNSKAASFLDGKRVPITTLLSLSIYLFTFLRAKHAGYGSNYDKIEDAKCKEEYDKLPQPVKEKYGYERDHFELLESLVRKCDLKVVKNKERLSKEQSDREGVITEDDVQRAMEIEEKIKKMTEDAETLGEEGEVDKSMQLMTEVENLTAIKTQLSRGRGATEASGGGSQDLSVVCEVSGNFMSSKVRISSVQFASLLHFAALCCTLLTAFCAG
jgi:hypothetical protein